MERRRDDTYLQSQRTNHKADNEAFVKLSPEHAERVQDVCIISMHEHNPGQLLVVEIEHLLKMIVSELRRS